MFDPPSLDNWWLISIFTLATLALPFYLFRRKKPSVVPGANYEIFTFEDWQADEKYDEKRTQIMELDPKNTIDVEPLVILVLLVDEKLIGRAVLSLQMAIDANVLRQMLSNGVPRPAIVNHGKTVFGLTEERIDEILDTDEPVSEVAEIRIATLSHLFIAPQYRSRGLGKTMVKVSALAALARGCNCLGGHPARPELNAYYAGMLGDVPRIDDNVADLRGEKVVETLFSSLFSGTSVQLHGQVLFPQ